MKRTSDHDGVEEMDRASPRVLTYAYYLTGDAYLAEELTREAYVWLFLRRRRVFLPEVVEVLQRRLSGQYARTLREQRDEGAPPPVAVPLREHETPPDLLAALQYLSREQRQLTVMHCFADLTVTDMGWVVRRWPSQVREQLQRAHTVLSTLSLTTNARTLTSDETLHDVVDRFMAPSGPPLHLNIAQVVQVGTQRERTRRRLTLALGAAAALVAALVFRATADAPAPSPPTPTRLARGDLAVELCRTASHLQADLGQALPSLRGYRALIDHDGVTPARVTVLSPGNKRVALTAAADTGVPGVSAYAALGHTLLVGVSPGASVRPLLVLTAGGEAARGTTGTSDNVTTPHSCAATLEVFRHTTTNGVPLPVSWRVMDMAWFNPQGVLQKTAANDVPQPEYLVLPHARITVNALRGVGMVVEQSALRGHHELRDLLASAVVRPLGVPARVRPVALPHGLPNPPNADIPWKSAAFSVYCVRLVSPTATVRGRYGSGPWQAMPTVIINNSVSLSCQEGPVNVIFTARWSESGGRMMQCQGATFAASTLTMQDNRVMDVHSTSAHS